MCPPKLLKAINSKALFKLNKAKGIKNSNAHLLSKLKVKVVIKAKVTLSTLTKTRSFPASLLCQLVTSMTTRGLLQVTKMSNSPN